MRVLGQNYSQRWSEENLSPGNFVHKRKFKYIIRCWNTFFILLFISCWTVKYNKEHTTTNTMNKYNKEYCILMSPFSSEKLRFQMTDTDNTIHLDACSTET